MKEKNNNGKKCWRPLVRNIWAKIRDLNFLSMCIVQCFSIHQKCWKENEDSLFKSIWISVFFSFHSVFVSVAIELFPLNLRFVAQGFLSALFIIYVFWCFGSFLGRMQTKKIVLLIFSFLSNWKAKNKWLKSFLEYSKFRINSDVEGYLFEKTKKKYLWIFLWNITN